MKLQREPAVADDKGFALIATISILVLLALISVGLLSLSTVTVRSAGNGQAMATARANARLALIMAIGELQKTVGPDQRITAPANIDPTNTRQPHLLGVWKSFKQANTETSAPNYESQKDGDFVQWLSSATPAKQTNRTYPSEGPIDPVTLVGSGTLPSPVGGDPATQYVEASTIAVSDDNGKRTGGYAWQVFDESLKANLTLSDPELGSNAERVAALGTTGVPGFHALADSDANYSPLESLVVEKQDKVISLDSSAFLGDSARFDPKASKAFHVLTTDSKNLLIDVANGGYQKDLSLLFAETTLPPDYANRHIYSEDVTPVASAPQRFNGAEPIPSPDPRWSLLHSHYNLYKEVGKGGGNYGLEASYVKRGLETEYFEKQQILPVIANAQFIFSMAPQLFALEKPYVGFLGFWVDVVVTLWNPYNVELEFDAMEIEFYRFPLQVEFFREDSSGLKSASSGKPVHIAYMFNPKNNSAGTANIQDKLPYRGRVLGPVTLKPGAFKVFGTASQTNNHQNLNYTEGLELREGWDQEKGGIFERYISTNEAYSAQCPWPGPKNKQQIQVKNGDVYSVKVSPAKVDRNTSFDETNGEEIVAYLKVFQGDGGVEKKVRDMDAFEEKLNKKRRQVGAIEINLPSSQLANSLPSFGRGEMSRLVVNSGNTKPPRDASKKVPFLIASLRLKTELDSQGSAGESSAMWLHNGIANAYSTTGISGDQDELAKAQQYEITWEPMTSWENIPTVEVDGENRGYGATGVTSGSGVNFAPFLQVPLAPATSLAQFSHAPLNAGGQAPLTTQIVGNSFNSPLLPLARKSNPGTLGVHLDHSYMANNTLFDGYFLSTAVAEDGPLDEALSRNLDDVVSEFFKGKKKLRNSNFELAEGVSAATSITSDDYDTFAQYLYNKGAFNVNSTSKKAWALFLASGTKESLPILDILTASTTLGVTQNSSDTAVSRFAPLIGDEEAEATLSEEEGRWARHRRLSPSQIMILAEKVVDEVKRRGPFQSVGEFVNRQLVNGSATANSGTLQTAIENSGFNTDFGETAPKNNEEFISDSGTGSTSDGAATQITQADLLNRLAPSITVRGDTFRIRAYGEAVSGGAVVKAWCEAVVQREHNFVDRTQDSTISFSDLNTANENFGRQFKIVSFRWLLPSEV